MYVIDSNRTHSTRDCRDSVLVYRQSTLYETWV